MLSRIFNMTSQNELTPRECRGVGSWVGAPPVRRARKLIDSGTKCPESAAGTRPFGRHGQRGWPGEQPRTCA